MQWSIASSWYNANQKLACWRRHNVRHLFVCLTLRMNEKLSQAQAIDRWEANQCGYQIARSSQYYNTGWHIMLIQTSRWHQIKSSVLACPSQARPGQNGTFDLMSTGGLNQPDVSPCSQIMIYYPWDRCEGRTPAPARWESRTTGPGCHTPPLGSYLYDVRTLDGGGGPQKAD